VSQTGLQYNDHKFRPEIVATEPDGVCGLNAIRSGRRLRILWVKVGGLWPVNSGGRLRSFHLIAELSRRHRVSVFTTHYPDEDEAELAQHLPHCEEVVSVPHAAVKRQSPNFILTLMRSWLTRLPVDLYKSRNARLRSKVARELKRGSFDLCIADFLFAVPNVPLGGSTPVVFFSHNVEYMIWKRLGASGMGAIRSALLQLEWRKMRRYEHQACKRSALTIAVSEQDRDLLLEGAPESQIKAISTGVDLEYFSAGDHRQEDAAEIVFSGSMDWHPNEDAVLYFIDSILPLLRQEIPQLSMTVVGRNPSRRLRKAAGVARVKVTGTTDDVRPFIRRAAVYVVPLRIGGGTRLKIYEALAMGKAVVSTSIGAEGLPLEEGVHILRADTPDTFSSQVLSLLRNEQQRKRLGDAGRRMMEQRFSWSMVAEEFEQHCLQVIP
jgi:glycosyltransferase involved in cell wall biosynthesis